MKMFDEILKPFGLYDEEEEEASTATPEPAPEPLTVEQAEAESEERREHIDSQQDEDKVDCVGMLEELEKEKGVETNWETSISDLLFLLDIDNSYEHRQELAIELGCPEEYMSDSAKMNTWLHTTVLEMLAEEGCNIPRELF